MILPAAAAHAEPFSMSIDNVILDMGGVSGVRAIDSGLEPPDPPATLSGDLTEGAVEVPKAGFVIPTKSAEISTGISANIDMEANDDIIGTFDAGTGELALNANLKATVAVLGSTCVISPIQLTLSSDNVEPYLGEVFASGIEGDGVVSASWSSLPAVTGGGSCGIVGQLISGSGGIAMAHGVHDFKTCESAPSDPRCESGPTIEAPKLPPVLNSAPLSSTDETSATFTYSKASGENEPVEGFECKLDSGVYSECNSGSQVYSELTEGDHTFAVRAVNSAGAGPEAVHAWTVTKKPSPPPEAKLAKLDIRPKIKTMKRGKRISIHVAVKNIGEATANGVRVCVNAPKRLVQVKKCLTIGQIQAGKGRTAKFVVKAKRRRGKAVLKFTTKSDNAGYPSGRATVKIR